MVVLTHPVRNCQRHRGNACRTETGKDPRPDAGGLDTFAARLVGPLDALCTSFHVALDTVDARRLRADPHIVSIPGFVLLDTGLRAGACARITRALLANAGNGHLSYTRTVNRERRARRRRLPTSGSVWLVEGTLDANPKQEPGKHANRSKSSGPTQGRHADLLHASRFAQCALSTG